MFLAKWFHALRIYSNTANSITRTKLSLAIVAMVCNPFCVDCMHVKFKTQTKEFAAAAERVRQNYSVPLAKGRERTISIPLLGGVTMCMTSLYCEGRRRLGASDSAGGLHIKQTLFGNGKKVSPELESLVSRQSALCPRLNWLGMNYIRSLGRCHPRKPTQHVNRPTRKPTHLTRRY